MGGNVIYTTLCNISNFEEQFFHKIEQVMRNIVLVNGNTGIWSIGYLPVTGAANMRAYWYITRYKVFVKYTFPKWAVCDQLVLIYTLQFMFTFYFILMPWYCDFLLNKVIALHDIFFHKKKTFSCLFNVVVVVAVV